MSNRHHRGPNRRQFLKQTALGTLAASGFGRPFHLGAAGAEDPPNTHNMLVVGERTIFLSHLPMFHALDDAKTAFRSPHRYQVILEATFTNGGKDVGEVYVKDRQAHAGTRIYTLNPDEFVITRLFTPEAKPQLGTFPATVFRGHLEQGGTPISGLDKAQVTVTRVVHGRLFEPQAKKPTELEYILFGSGSERFLAHAIFAPPDFDHVLSVTLTNHELTDKELSQDVRLVLPGRKNVAPERLREKQRVPGVLRVGAAGSSTSKVDVEAGVEFYFEEGELLVPPTFEPTVEEKKL